MSQLVACCFEGGVLLAADRRVAVERRGRDEIHALRKLFPLGASAAVATSGAAVGIAVSRSLHRFLQGRASPHLEDLEAYAVSVFQKEYAEFIRQGERWFRIHPHAHRLSYVLLAGQEGAGTHAFRFYASEAHHEPYRLLPTGAVLTAPRRLGLEARLGRALAAGASGDTLVQVVLEGLRVIGKKEPAAGPPFDWVVIRGAGTTEGTDEGG
ncbi:MAG: hypothetical protein AB1578_10620 [Thermodesulfobacteriota bacterium]